VFKCLNSVLFWQILISQQLLRGPDNDILTFGFWQVIYLLTSKGLRVKLSLSDFFANRLYISAGFQFLQSFHSIPQKIQTATPVLKWILQIHFWEWQKITFRIQLWLEIMRFVEARMVLASTVRRRDIAGRFGMNWSPWRTKIWWVARSSGIVTSYYGSITVGFLNRGPRWIAEFW